MNNQNKSRSKSDMMSQQNNVFSRQEVNHAEKRAHIIGLAVLLKRDRFDDDVFFVVGRKR